MRFKIALTAIAVATIIAMTACASSDSTADVDPASGATRTPAPVTPTPTSSDAGQSGDVPATPTPRPGILPAEFNLADYINGDEIAELVAEAGDEKPFPAELLPTSPELPNEFVQSLVKDYLGDTRVVIVKQGFRDLRIEAVFDYCDNRTRQLKYKHTPTGPSLINNPKVKPSVGWVNEWAVEHTELTPWYEPYIAGVFQNSAAAYLSRGWDATPVQRFVAPGDDGLARIGKKADFHVRVFDYPECADPIPVLEYSPAQWTLIGLERMLEIPDGMSIEDPQQDPEKVVAFWDDAFSDLTTFSNLNGVPFLYFCANHRGVVLGKDHARLRQPFTWRIEDASDIAPNAIWVVYEYDNTSWGIEWEVVHVEKEFDPYRGVVASHLEDCSVERGFEYVDSVADEIDWWQNRPATPVPSK